MKHYSDIDRTASLWRLYPEIFTENRTVLYIGAREDRFDYSDMFNHFKIEITILEAWEKNCEVLTKKGLNVICGDVRNIENIPGITGNKWDLVFWWHGPEHVEADEVQETIIKLMKLRSNVVVLGCPWGVFEQGELGGNPYERHVSAIYPEMLEYCGYTVEALGKPDTIGSGLVAVEERCQIRPFF